MLIIPTKSSPGALWRARTLELSIFGDRKVNGVEGRQIVSLVESEILQVTQVLTNIRNFSEPHLSFLFCWFRLSTNKQWQKALGVRF